MKQYFHLLKALEFAGNLIKSRDLLTKELIDQKISLKNNLYSVDEYRDLEKIKKYLIGEMSWYFSGDLDIQGILKYSKFWNKIKNSDNTANSNYGHIVFYKLNKYNVSQFDWCKNNLLNDVNTRKAVILYNDKEFCYYDNKDYCCTQLQQFFVRDNRLICKVYIRSSDVIRGLSYDIPYWSIVQQQLLFELQKKYETLELGSLIIDFGSVHIYEDHFELLKNINSSDMRQYFLRLKSIIPLDKSQTWYEENLINYLEIEEHGIVA